MIIKAKNISKQFNDLKVLDCINLNIEANEIVSIYGASGSGKTTLLNLLGLLDLPTSGEIHYFNKMSYDNYTSFERVKTIGYIFQFHHLLEEFNIIDNLIIPQLLSGKNQKESTNYAIDLLKLINLEKLQDRYPNEISGGERQRIAVLRGVINKPKIVFADEPTGNLDDNNSSSILKLLLKLKNDFNISFIIGTHDKQVTKISDKSFYIKNGRLEINKIGS